MGRIRSLHPGQWSDEEFVESSPLARLLCLGLRNEADDNGIFQWRPKQLKMRLLPADDCDPVELLDELVANNQIRRFEVDGQAYGAIRNFREFQSPQKPKAKYPLPDELVAYVTGGGPKPSGSGSAPVPEQSPTSTVPVQDSYRTAPDPVSTGKERKGEEEERKEGGDAPAGADPNEIVFQGDVVRINRRDFNRWKASYPAIADLISELQGLDDWLRTQPEPERKRWFHMVSGALRKKHQAAAAEAASAAVRPRRDPLMRWFEDDQPSARPQEVAEAVH